MTQASEIGAIILPPVPAFYALPESVDDIINHTVGRALDLFDIETDLVRRWGEPAPGGKAARGYKQRKPVATDD
jgi:4-hydroxy-3-polyprenylbenzoate decarboxylase